MPSFTASLYRLLLRAKKLPNNSSVPNSVKWFRDMNLQTPHPILLGKCKFAGSVMHGVPLVTITPPQPADDKTILFLHGGGFVGGPHLLHWVMAARIATAANCRLVAVNYPLAPETVFPDALNLIQQIYLHLRPQHKQIIALGDSAGGNLATALTLKLRDENLPMPDKLALISPALDLNLENPDIDELEKADAMLNRQALKTLRSAYAGNTPLTHHYVSPLFAPLHNLPPTLLLCGSAELFYPDCRLFAQKVQESGGNISFYTGNQMFHDWTLFPLLPEAAKAIAKIGEFVKEG